MGEYKWAEKRLEGGLLGSRLQTSDAALLVLHHNLEGVRSNILYLED